MINISLESGSVVAFPDTFIKRNTNFSHVVALMYKITYPIHKIKWPASIDPQMAVLLTSFKDTFYTWQNDDCLFQIKHGHIVHLCSQSEPVHTISNLFFLPQPPPPPPIFYTKDCGLISWITHNKTVMFFLYINPKLNMAFFWIKVRPQHILKRDKTFTFIHFIDV